MRYDDLSRTQANVAIKHIHTSPNVASHSNSATELDSDTIYHWQQRDIRETYGQDFTLD